MLTTTPLINGTKAQFAESARMWRMDAELATAQRRFTDAARYMLLAQKCDTKAGN